MPNRKSQYRLPTGTKTGDPESGFVRNLTVVFQTFSGQNYLFFPDFSRQTLWTSRRFGSWTARQLINARVIKSVTDSNGHLYFPGQHYSITVFKNFSYLWSFSRLFKVLKISTLNSRTFHTFSGSVRTLLNELEQRNACYFTLFNYAVCIRSLLKPNTSNWLKVEPYCQQQKSTGVAQGI